MTSRSASVLAHLARWVGSSMGIGATMFFFGGCTKQLSPQIHKTVPKITLGDTWELDELEDHWRTIVG